MADAETARKSMRKCRRLSAVSTDLSNCQAGFITQPRSARTGWYLHGAAGSLDNLVTVILRTILCLPQLKLWSRFKLLKLHVDGSTLLLYLLWAKSSLGVTEKMVSLGMATPRISNFQKKLNFSRRMQLEWQWLQQVTLTLAASRRAPLQGYSCGVPILTAAWWLKKTRTNLFRQ